LKCGPPPQGTLTEAQAAERMLALVRDYDAEQRLLEPDADLRASAVAMDELGATLVVLPSS
jgi:hypothetical protein